jgi:hypothetical protein
MSCPKHVHGLGRRRKMDIYRPPGEISLGELITDMHGMEYRSMAADYGQHKRIMELCRDDLKDRHLIIERAIEGEPSRCHLSEGTPNYQGYHMLKLFLSLVLVLCSATLNFINNNVSNE